MVEITQEEFERLKGFETKVTELEGKLSEEITKHNETKEKFGTLKDDYIAICKGQRGSNDNNTDDFDAICARKFGK